MRCAIRFSLTLFHLVSSKQARLVHSNNFDTVFSLVSAHACNSIFIGLVMWNEMDYLNRSCSVDLVLFSVYCVQYAQFFICVRL